MADKKTNQNKKKQPEKKKKLKVFNVISIILVLLVIGSFGTFSYFLIKLNMLPMKYLIIGYIVILLIIGGLIYLLFSKKKKGIKIIAMILLLMGSILSCIGAKYLISTYDFFKGTKKDYDTLTYSVIVLKDSNYQNIEDLKEKTITLLEDEYINDVKKELENKITFTANPMEIFISMPEELVTNKTDAIVLEESYVTLVYDEIEGFEDKTSVIYTFDIQVKAHEEEKIGNITEEPFILYVSGIDQYGNVNSVRGRSDVNQLIVVNPKTHKILLVNTPRDYYVQLDGTTGIKDKLTHAGVYGINKSIKTLENFYDIDIKHYLRVNFNTLIKLVDVIGGIDINSDQAFKPRHGDQYVTKGMNHFDGKMALAYARERYAYATGDNHRGQNQQQVITAIINKVTSSSVIISKYNSILNTLDGSFQTDMSMEEITAFIRYQLDKMPKWEIESYAVTGTGSMDYTYSMGMNYLLYVMLPNEESVNTAKTKINKVLNEG